MPALARLLADEAPIEVDEELLVVVWKRWVGEDGLFDRYGVWHMRHVPGLRKHQFLAYPEDRSKTPDLEWRQAKFLTTLTAKELAESVAADTSFAFN
jgi:hypothetical protein